MRYLLRWVAASALLCCGSVAVAGDVSGELIKWHPVTVSFNGPSSSESATNPNPFLDYRLQVAFTAPSGEVFNVPGFFDGDGNGNGTGNIWRVRFSPSEPGTWTYSAAMRSGSNVAVDLSPSAGDPLNLAGASGSFFIADRNSNAQGFLRWGRLQYVGGHYLKFADGPYWIKGGVDSPENFLGYKGFDNTVDQSGGASTAGLENGVHRYLPHVDDFNSGDPNFTSEDTGFDGRGIIGSLNYLSSQNVNSIYFLPMNLGGDGRETYPFVAPGNNDFNKTHYDISKLSQWNIVLNHAQQKGIALHFVLAETEVGNENWFDNGSLGTQRRLYYRELIARFGYLLAIKWNLSEENDFSDAELRSFADYISALDWAQHQLTFHIKPNQIDNYSPHLGDPRFDTTSIQYNTDRANDHAETMRARSASNGRRLVIDLDENNPASTGLTTDNADDLRKRVLYDVYFSGANIEWYFGYHSLPLGGDMRTESFRTREPMYRYMWYARKFMQDHLEFWNMQPADNLLTGESSSFGGGQVFSKPGDVYAIYLPDASPSGSISLPSGGYTKRWFNPRTGQFQGTAQVINGGNTGLGTPPNSVGEDWVVLIESDDGGNNPPPPPEECVPTDEGGYLSFEAESMMPIGDWTLKSDSAASGNQYIVWEGAQFFGNQDNGRMSIDFQIDEPGIYRIQWHTKSFIAPGSEHNDSWMKVSGGSADFYAERGTTRYYPRGSGKTPNPNGTSGNGYFKIYTSANDWGWQTTTSDNEGFPVFVNFPTAGAYRFEIAARSSSHGIDRIVLHKSNVSDVDARDLNRPLSCDSGGNPPPPPPPGNQPPIVAFSEPTDGQQFATGSNVSVLAAASDADGSVANVKLYLNDSLVRQENVAPYQWGHDGRDLALQNLAQGSYELRLIATDNGGATTESVITINVGASAPVEVSLNSVNVTEGAGQAIVEARLSRAASTAVGISVHTIPKTAVNGKDFFGLTNQFTIPAGSLSVQIPVVILDDTEEENEEFFNLRIFEASGAAIGNRLATVTIGDNDGGVGPDPTLSVRDLGVDEGDVATLTVVLSNPSSSPVTVQMATSPGTAINGQDFYGAWQTLTLAPGETEASLQVQTIDDTETEPNEAFSYRIFNATGATISKASATVSIRDN